MHRSTLLASGLQSITLIVVPEKEMCLWQTKVPTTHPPPHPSKSFQHLPKPNSVTLNLELARSSEVSGKHIVFFFGRGSPKWDRRFLDLTQRRTTVGRTPLDEWSVRRRDLYLTTHSTHNRQASMPPVGFEPTISVGQRPQTYALDREATGTGTKTLYTV